MMICYYWGVIYAHELFFQPTTIHLACLDVLIAVQHTILNVSYSLYNSEGVKITKI